VRRELEVTWTFCDMQKVGLLSLYFPGGLWQTSMSGQTAKSGTLRIKAEALIIDPVKISYYQKQDFSFPWCKARSGPGPLSIEASGSRSATHITFRRTRLDEWSARRRELYLTKYKTSKRQTFMPLRYSKPQSQQASGPRPKP